MKMYSYSSSGMKIKKSNMHVTRHTGTREDSISCRLNDAAPIPAVVSKPERIACIPKRCNSSAPGYFHHHYSPSTPVACNSSFSSFTIDRLAQSHEGRLTPPPMFSPQSEPRFQSFSLTDDSTNSSNLTSRLSNLRKQKEHIRRSKGTGVANPPMKSLSSALEKPRFQGYPRFTEEKTEEDWSSDVSSRGNRNKRKAMPSHCSNLTKFSNPVVKEDDVTDQKLPAKKATIFEHQQHEVAYDHYGMGCHIYKDDRSTSEFSDLTSSSRHYTCSVSEEKSQAEVSNKYMEVYPGVSVPFRGTRETLQAIYDDKFSPNWCYLCNETIFCIQDADYILCPMCKVIAPADVSNNKSINRRGGVGIGFTMEILSDVISNRQV